VDYNAPTMKKLLPVLCGLLLACTRESPAPGGLDASVAVAPKQAPAPIAAPLDASVAEAPKQTPVPGGLDGSVAEAPADAGAGASPCSASTLSPEPKRPATPLSPKAEAMRRRIIAAAVACDYAALTALSREVGKEFNLALGGEADVGTFWRKREEQGEPVLSRLVRVLNLPHVGEGEFFLWPSAAGMFRKDKDWKAVEGLYPPETLAQWKASEKGYAGLRTGIHVNGDWLFAVSGEQGAPVP
jgi:hypothetical protein